MIFLNFIGFLQLDVNLAFGNWWPSMINHEHDLDLDFMGPVSSGMSCMDWDCNYITRSCSCGVTFEGIEEEISEQYLKHIDLCKVYKRRSVKPPGKSVSKLIELKKLGLCPFCEKKSNHVEFKDSISEVESKQSGLCQNCQDKVFGV